MFEEYAALKHAAEWVSRHDGKDKIEIKGDSSLVIRQMTGSWTDKIRNL